MMCCLFWTLLVQSKPFSDVHVCVVPLPPPPPTPNSSTHTDYSPTLYIYKCRRVDVKKKTKN